MEIKRLDQDIQFSNKILIFASEYLPITNNTTLAIKGITDHIDTIKFDMITIKGDKELSSFDKIGKINVHRIGIGIRWIDQYILAFWGHHLAQKMHKERNYSAIWGIGSDYSGFSAMFFKNKNKSIPFILALQNEDDPKHLRKRVGFFDPWFRRIFSLADHIHCVSSSLEYWARRMGAYKNIEIIPNGIEYDNFYMEPLRKFHIDELKEKLGVTQQDKVILAGPAKDKKRVKNLLTAFSFFCEMEKQPVRLIIFEVGRKIKKFKKIAAKLNVLDKITWIDKINYSILPNYFWVSDLFIDLSKNNLVGNWLLEAMASQTLIMEERSSATPPYLKDKENCFRYDFKDTLEIADGIKTLLLNESIQDKLIKNAEKLAKEQFNYEKIKEELEKIFDEALRVN